MTAAERWRPILGGDYEVSDHGRIRRLTSKKGAKVGRILRPGLSVARGYPLVVVGGGGERRRTRHIHDFVAQAFLGPRPEGASVNHIDGDKANNLWTNLEYVTHQENMAHASRTGLLKVGKARRNTKLTEDDVRAIRKRKSAGESLNTLAKAYGVSQITIFDAVHRRSWRHVA